MTINELITNYLEDARNTVFLYASDYRMNSPRKGYESLFRAAQERVELLEDLLGQLK